MKKEIQIQKNQEKEYSDFYLRIRKKIMRWFDEGKLAGMNSSGWMGKIAGYLILFPDLIYLLIKLFTDSKVPVKYKSMLMVLFGYLISPIDFIPDYFPVIGFIDDLVITIIFLNKVINSNSAIMVEKIKIYWIGKEDIFKTISEIITITNKCTAKITRSLADFIERKMR